MNSLQGRTPQSHLNVHLTVKDWSNYQQKPRSGMMKSCKVQSNKSTAPQVVLLPMWQVGKVPANQRTRTAPLAPNRRSQIQTANQRIQPVGNDLGGIHRQQASKRLQRVKQVWPMSQALPVPVTEILNRMTKSLMQ